MTCSVLLNDNDTNWDLRLGDWRDYPGVHECGRKIVGQNYGIALCELHIKNGQTPLDHIIKRMIQDIETWIKKYE